MIGIVELDTIAIDEANGCVGTGGGDGELFQENHPMQSSAAQSYLSGVARASFLRPDHWHRPESTCGAPSLSADWIRSEVHLWAAFGTKKILELKLFHRESADRYPRKLPSVFGNRDGVVSLWI